jgi:hypothetical protein
MGVPAGFSTAPSQKLPSGYWNVHPTCPNPAAPLRRTKAPARIIPGIVADRDEIPPWGASQTPTGYSYRFERCRVRCRCYAAFRFEAFLSSGSSC